GGGRKDDGELAARARLALDRDTAAMCLHDALNETEAESGPLHARRDPLGRAIERFEDSRLLGRGNANSTVGDADVHFPADAFRPHANPLTGFAVLDGIGDQVLEDAAQRRFLADDRRKRYLDRVLNLN